MAKKGNTNKAQLKEILSEVVDDGRKSAAYPWCLFEYQIPTRKGHATCNRILQRIRF